MLDLENPAAYTGMFVGFTVSGFEIVHTNLSNGNIDLRGTDQNEKLETANVGDNKIDGRGGNDTLTGGFGDDIIDGGAGNDRINGGDGSDTMTGGAGNDVYLVDAAGDVVKEAAKGGVDTVISEVSIDLTKAAWKNIENVTFNGFGNSKLVGSAANNILIGGNGNDTIDGSGGNDRLSGGDGNNKYTGGAGADTFIFDKEVFFFSTVDRITDFGKGADRLDLKAIDGNSGKPGDQPLHFIGDDHFSNKAGEVRFEHEHKPSGNVTVIEIETNGDGKVDAEITLEGKLTLHQNDFIL